MSPTVHAGGCLCGACRYEINGPLESAGVCYCEDCRRVSGSAFGVSFRVSVDEYRLSGETGSFAKTADSGVVLTRHFCNACGSPLFTASQAHPNAVYFKAGTLDDPTQLRVDRQAWTISKVSWADIPSDIASYPKGRS